MKLFYYILMDPDKKHVTKLGITKDPATRLRAYRTAAPTAYWYAIYELPDKIHEKKILDLLRERFSVRSELVACNPHIVKNIVESYFMDNDIDY